MRRQVKNTIQTLYKNGAVRLETTRRLSKTRLAGNRPCRKTLGNSRQAHAGDDARANNPKVEHSSLEMMSGWPGPFNLPKKSSKIQDSFRRFAKTI